MDTKQLKHHINNTNDTATFLIESVDIKLIKRFDKACKEMDKVLVEIKSYFPDAHILASPQSLSLYIGNKDMGDYKYEGYSRYSYTTNPEFVITSAQIESLEIDI